MLPTFVTNILFADLQISQLYITNMHGKFNYFASYIRLAFDSGNRYNEKTKLYLP